ncbi:unnamed protein product [Soboliphyme baturini]|uniref:L-serine deaminase n=1 Tax=Soboliphyme baturini TaxID=241478 RepID=A0A183IDQ5_9BILA|nr:unnamed protein product [Soboliphyme baturini]
MFKAGAGGTLTKNLYLRLRPHVERAALWLPTVPPIAEQDKRGVGGWAVSVKVPSADEVPKDPFCDPDHPLEVTFQEVSAAAFRIRDSLMRTPCTRSDMLSKMLGMEIYFKKEFMHVTGSFKERGIRNTLLKLTPEQRKRGTITASAGNHALALSYHGDKLHIPVTVVMPIISPLMKISRCRQYNANIIVQGANINESPRHFRYDHPDVIAGNGTAGLEIIEQVPDVDAVLVPIGGAGLIAGVGCAIKYVCPSTQVIGVEGESCPSFTKAMQSGKPEFATINPTLADGLSVPLIGYNAYKTAKKFVDKVVTVGESEIALAILRLVEIEKAVVEGAGAVGLAALIGNHLPELKGKKVVVLLCGANIDTAILGRCLERGLAEDGRLINFQITVSDRPGGTAEITHLLMKSGVSIRDIFHERAFLKSDVFSVRVSSAAAILNIQNSKDVFLSLILQVALLYHIPRYGRMGSGSCIFDAPLSYFT